MEGTTQPYVETNFTTMNANLTEEMMKKKKEMFMKLCVYAPMPKASELIKGMNTGQMVMQVALIIMATIVVAIFIEQVLYMNANIKSSARRRLSVIQVGLAPVYAVTSVVGTLFPAGHVMIDFVCSVYFGCAMHALLVLMLNYFNGKRQMLKRFDGKKVTLHTGPLCCCLLCIPDVKLKKKSFTVIWYMTFQAACVRPVVLFFQGVFQTDKQIAIPSLFYAGCLTVSMLTGMWAIVIFRKASAEYLGQFRITGKFVYFQLILLIANVQSFIINVSYVSCNLPYTVMASKLVLNYQIMVFEFFLIALMGRFLYRREEDDDKLEPIENGKNTSDVESCSDSIAEEKRRLSEIPDIANGNHIVIKTVDDIRVDSLA